MAVRVRADNPAALLRKIKRAIDDDVVRTWTYDDDGDFAYEPQQWAGRGWFRPHVTDSSLVFNILAPVGRRMTRADYGVYHGRLVEMLLTHFDREFSSVDATALPTAGDAV